MKNVVWFRIDDRLIHGQVCTSWMKMTDANEIMVVDDKLVNDAMMKRVLAAAAPKGVPMSVLTVDEAIATINGSEAGKERILCLAKFPQTYERMIDGGVKMDLVNLGGMGFRGDRKMFHKNIAANDEEVQSFRNIMAKGVKISYQMTNRDAAQDLATILK